MARIDNGRQASGRQAGGRQHSGHGRDFATGMRAMVPWLIGVAPFGFVIGISAAQAGIPTMAGWLTGPMIFAGSAQLTAIQLLDGGAGALTVIGTVVVINLRLVLYSAAMAPHWRDTPLWFRLVGGYALIEPTFAVGAAKYAEDPDRRRGHAHYLGGAAVLWLTWAVAIAVGATAGAQLPAWLRLEFVMPLYLIGELVPMLRRTATRRAVATAAAVALACLSVPMHLGIPLGILAGAATGIRTQAKKADVKRIAAEEVSR